MHTIDCFKYVKWGGFMSELRVIGGKNLCGSVVAPGAKNSILPLLAASVLVEGLVRFSNVPRLSDVFAAYDILCALGCKVATVKDGCAVDATTLSSSCIPPYLMETMRSSLFFLAPVLKRTKCAKITQPGGCKLGARPIDIHLNGLEAMGAKIIYGSDNDDCIELRTKDGLIGADYTLKFPSVGATETLIMAGVTAKGKTVLRGVAKEPEIEDLVRFLISCGARIAGVGTDVLYIDGVSDLNGATHNVCPDRISVGTVLCAVAACGGEVIIKNCNSLHVSAVYPMLKKLGCGVTVIAEDTICAYSCGVQNGIGDVFADIYPAFSTDCAPILMAACLRAKGLSSCTDTIFENRFACSRDFSSLGANVKISKNKISVCGVKQLNGATLYAKDLRGGAALVIAAMQACGQSTVKGVEYINRGYEDIAALFSKLGADIKLVDV